jgi:hypothetical protein
MICECGLDQLNSVTVALNVVSWPLSYMDIEWWANAGPEISREAASAAKSDMLLVFTVAPLGIQISTARCGPCTYTSYTFSSRELFQQKFQRNAPLTMQCGWY